MHDFAHSTPLWLAVLGVVVNALVGALRGYTDEQHHWDIVGVVTFALLMGLGGGVIRDLLVGELPPLSLRTPWPIAAVLVTVLLARLVARWVVRFPLVLGTLESLALGLFAIAGAAAAVDHGLVPIASVLVGVLSAVGGGVIVDVVRGEVPTILQPSRPQALLGAGVAATYLVLARWGADPAYVVSVVLGVIAYLLVERADVRTRSLTQMSSDRRWTGALTRREDT